MDGMVDGLDASTEDVGKLITPHSCSRPNSLLYNIGKSVATSHLGTNVMTPKAGV